MGDRVVWLAVNRNGEEVIATGALQRRTLTGAQFMVWWECIDSCCLFMELPSGTIEKLIGRRLTWQDDPVEYRG